MKKIFSLFSAALLVNSISAQNVGIGTTTPTNAGLVVNTKVGSVHAIFGNNTSGVSIESAWPGIHFNNYASSGRKALISGFASGIEMNPATGLLSIYTTPASTTGGNAITAQTALSISKEGNIGIGTSPLLGTKLFVDGDIRINGGMYNYQNFSNQGLIIQRSESETTPSPILKLINGYIGVNQTSTHRTCFEHVTSAANISGNASTLDYPGAESTDMVLITHRIDNTYAFTAFAVYYDTFVSKWKIVTENISNMPVNQRFNVLVIKNSN